MGKISISEARQTYLPGLMGFDAGNLRGQRVWVLTPVIETAYRFSDLYREAPAEFDAIHAAWRETNVAYRTRGRRSAPRGLAYVVTSYGVPIVWVTHDGTVTRTALRWSQTTARHTAMAYDAITNGRGIHALMRETAEYDALETWPKITEDGRTVWACCESSIGPECAHKVTQGQ